MDVTIYPSKLSGEITVPASKSISHRMLICAAFADRPTVLLCNGSSGDLEATVNCLNAIGATIERTTQGYIVTPVDIVPESATLQCGQSGSTLRFLLPIVGALGIDSTFNMEGRLSERPLAPLCNEMERMGCVITRPTDNTLRCTGRLQSGLYKITGNISSQFITGLLLSCAIMDGKSTITIIDSLESKPYVTLTQNVMELFGVQSENLYVNGVRRFISPGIVHIEGDWSSAAFYIAANALQSNVVLNGLNFTSAQGDQHIQSLISNFDEYATINVSDFPDLVPILSVVAAAKQGGCFTGIHRLRLKESDRVESVISMLHALGIYSEVQEDSLQVYPGKFNKCTINPQLDHRIAMAAAIAATVAEGPVRILDAHCVGKSYPGFWDDYRNLGGRYELDIR